MDVSVIIINYNTKQITAECIDSVFDKTSDIIFEVILVDNASSDGSIEYFAGDQRITFIQNQSNEGFGRANNKGMAIAKGKYIFLLNSDTILLGNAIKKFYDFAEANQHLNIGALGGILLYPDMRESICFGHFPSIRNLLLLMGNALLRHLKLSDGYARKTIQKVSDYGYTYVDYVMGADLFMPLSVATELNGFDPDYFLYYEETDLQKRMEANGYNRIIFNNRDIVHLEGASVNTSDKNKNRLTHKRYTLSQQSFYIYIYKHFTKPYCFIYRLMHGFRQVISPILFNSSFSMRERQLSFIQLIKKTAHINK